MLGGNTCYRSIVVVFLVTCLASFVDGRRPPRSVAGRVPGLPSFVTVDGFNMARDGLRPMYTAPDDNSRMPGRYIVVMKDTSDSDAVQHVMGKYRSTVLSAQSEGRRRGHPDVMDRFHMETVAMEMNVLKGFVAEMTPDDVLIMRTMPDVEYLEEDQVFEMQQSPVPWHLDRIDQQDLPLDGRFNRQNKLSVSETSECPVGYQPFGDACFKPFDEAKNYTAAKAVCQKEGGILAEPRNSAVNDFLIELKTSLNSRVRFWIGLTDRQKEGTWRWNDGEKLNENSFTRWAKGEPNQAGNEDCAVFEADSKWNDVPCGLSYRFICQRPAFVLKQMYVGCYRDGGSLDIRDLTGDVTVDEDNLTPTSCLSYCTSGGYHYAGLQYGKECFCGDSFGQFGAAPESECNTPCTGDAAEFCGGNWRNSIYRTITDECVLGNGASYRGSMSTTQSGYTCQRWDSQSPHEHVYQQLFPTLQLDRNFCRNPGGGSEQPWCYTTDPGIRWEYCNIPRCDSVDVYIVDSGIRYSHEEFEGRADWSGFDAHDTDGSNKGNDLEGHGTHVAALVGGKTFGVNPRVLLRSVRVLNSRGQGSTFSVLDGLNHIYDKITSNRGARGVVVMSLSSRGVSQSVNKASQELVLLGLPVVVAAGNAGDDACNRSPAGEAEVITVGGTRKTDELYDRTDEAPPGGTTAHGSCVDIFAPAQEVLSAGVECDSCRAVLSGTSQAAPITAGVVTKLLSRDPSMTPAQIRMMLLSTATANKLDFSPLPEDSRLKTSNKLLHVPAVPLKETAACRTVWSLKSNQEKGSVASAACNVNETMLSCSSVTDGIHTGEFPLDIPNGRQICVAENGKAGSSVYALARCCVLPGSPKCYFKTQKSSNKRAISALAKCDQSPGDVLTGCSVSGDRSVEWSIRGQKECLARGRRGDKPKAHAFCCQGDDMDCWQVHSQFSPDNEVVASCPDGSVLTGCSARSSEGGRILGARALDRACIAHGHSRSDIQALAICCSVNKRLVALVEKTY